MEHLYRGLFGFHLLRAHADNPAAVSRGKGIDAMPLSMRPEELFGEAENGAV